VCQVVISSVESAVYSMVDNNGVVLMYNIKIHCICCLYKTVSTKDFVIKSQFGQSNIEIGQNV